MKRFSTNSRLLKYTAEEKRRLKLYKRKKLWVVAGMSFLSLPLLSDNHDKVSADSLETTTTTKTDVNASEASQAKTQQVEATDASEKEAKADTTTKEQGTSVATVAENQNESKTTAPANNTPVASAPQVAAETATKEAPKAPVTPEVQGANSEKAATENSNKALEEQAKTPQKEAPADFTGVKQEQTATLKPAMDTTADSSNLAESKAAVLRSSFRAVASDNTQADKQTTDYYNGPNTIALTQVKAMDSDATIKRKDNSDGTTEYLYETYNTLGISAGAAELKVSYTGKKGDTFTLIVTPNGKVRDFYARVTGDPKKEGGYSENKKYTWTIDDVSENVTVTRTQVLTSSSLFSEYIPSRNNPPYDSGASGTVLESSKAGYTFSFLINGKPLPQERNSKLTVVKLPGIDNIDTRTTAIGYGSDASRIVTVDVDYLYSVDLGKSNGYLGINYSKMYLEIPVPEHWVLNEEMTAKYIKNGNDPVGGGNFELKQPGGAGTNIIVKSKEGNIALRNYLRIPFIGKYTSSETTGKFGLASGWVDVGDGKKNYFGKINVDDRTPLTSVAKGTLLSQKVEPRSEYTHENYDLMIGATNERQTGVGQTRFNSEYTSKKTNSILNVKRPIQRQLVPGSPLLYNIGLSSTGLTEYTPHYHIDFPEEITTTGVTLPMNLITNDYSDYASYNVAQSGYTVTVTGDDGSKITQRLLAGENYNPITGMIDHFGEFKTGARLADGIRIVSYDIVPDNPYFANSYQGDGERDIRANDLSSGKINILGFLNDRAKEGGKYVSTVTVSSENVTRAVKVTVSPSETLKNTIQRASPSNSSLGSATRQTSFHAGENFTLSFSFMGKTGEQTNNKPNLDAGGILVGKPNETATDGPGGGFSTQYYPIKEPIVYFTLPEQTVLDSRENNKFWSSNAPEPKVSIKEGKYGNTIVVLDWTGTGFETPPDWQATVYLKVQDNVVNGFDVGQTDQILYEYTDVANNKVIDLYSAGQLKVKGVSTDGLVAHQPNITPDNDTSWIQLGSSSDLEKVNGVSQTDGQIEFDDGTVVKTRTMGDTSGSGMRGNNNTYFRITAPIEVSPAPLIKGIGSATFSKNAFNYPIKDFTESNGVKTGLQKLQFGMVNNTDKAIKNVLSVMNLPQVGKVDGNNPTAKQEFTLNISGSGRLSDDPSNNKGNNESVIYYATDLATLSTDGTMLTFSDGSTWTKGNPLSNKLLTKEQVTDWSLVKSLVLLSPSIRKYDKVLYEFDMYSPTSESNMSKKATLFQAGGYDGQLSLVVGQVDDIYSTYANLRYVDQDGHEINGHPRVRGEARFDEASQKVVVENEELFGQAGKSITLGTPPKIKGYVYSSTDAPSITLAPDGSSLITRVYEVNKAKLLVNSLKGELLETSYGDPTPNTGSNYQDHRTGVSTITFRTDDKRLVKAGYSYKIKVVDRSGNSLADNDGRSTYNSLAEALAKQNTFDDKIDKGVVTQNFIVEYTPDFQRAVIVSDNDPENRLPEDVVSAQSNSTYYSDGSTGGLMFYQNGSPVLSNDSEVDGQKLFKREGYRYTVLAPDGKKYKSIDAALAAKLKFDNTNNSGTTDANIQVYTLHYADDIQNLKMTIIDEQGVKQGDSYKAVKLKENMLIGSGLSNSAVMSDVKLNYDAIIQNFLDSGYVLVSKDPMPTHYDDDSNTDQVVVVVLKHGQDEIAGEDKKTVTETINYVYGNGVKRGEQAAPQYTKDFTFTSTLTVDKITGETLATNWSPNQTAPGVDSPMVSGYTADKLQVEPKDVAHDTTDLNFTVSYLADTQRLTLTVIDDKTNETLRNKELLGQGDSGTTVSANVYQRYQNYLTEYEKAGYTLVSRDELPETYDSDSAVDQNVVIHLTHGQKETTGAEKTVNQTITYVYGNGPKVGQEAAKTYTKAYKFTSVDTRDAVTDEVLKTTWSPAQTTTEVVSPSVAGYVPDQTSVASQTLDHTNDDLTTEVSYRAGEQVVNVHYIDVYGVEGTDYSPTTGEELTKQRQSLHGAADASYTNTLWDYASVGYELVKKDTGAESGTYDADPSSDQNYYVYLTHGMKQVVGTPVNVKRTIEYIYRGGPKTGTPVTKPDQVIKTFVPTYTVDKVTRQTIGEPTWNPEQQTFVAVDSPFVPGYTPDQAQVAAMVITPKNTDETVTVYYDTDDQRLTYTVVDETLGKTLVDHELLGNGESESLVPVTVLQDYQDIIAAYQKRGYELVSYDKLPAKFDNDSNTDQNVTLRLVHGTFERPGADKTVTQKVSYVYENGPKAGQEVVPNYTKQVTFTSIETVDKVTKTVVKTVWSAPQTLPAVASPSVNGYLADQAQVAAQTVDHTTKDIEQVVKYHAGEQLVKVHYIDVSGKELNQDELTPTSGQEISRYAQALTGAAGSEYINVLRDYQADGYVLVKAQAEASKGVFDENPMADQSYYVYLTHGTKTATGEPLVITDMIKFEYGNGPRKGQPARPDMVTTKTFVPTYTIDLVTGQILNTKWSGDGEVDPIVVPQIEGYTPDKLVVPGKVLSPETGDQTQTIYYTMDDEIEVSGKKETSTSRVGEHNGSADQGGMLRSSQLTNGNVGREVVEELPQTGDDTDEKALLGGLGLLSGATLLGIADLGKNRRKKKRH